MLTHWSYVILALTHRHHVNSLWPSGTIWRQGFESTLAQVMACCLWHQAITWTNVDLSSVRSSDIHLRVVSQKIPQPSVTKISLKTAYLKFHSNHPGVNELTGWIGMIQINSSLPRPNAMVNFGPLSFWTHKIITGDLRRKKQWWHYRG